MFKELARVLDAVASSGGKRRNTSRVMKTSPDKERWITSRGHHIRINGEGEITAGGIPNTNIGKGTKLQPKSSNGAINESESKSAVKDPVKQAYEWQIETLKSRKDIENAIEDLLDSHENAAEAIDTFYDNVDSIGRKKGIDTPYVEDLSAEELLKAYKETLKDLGYISGSNSNEEVDIPNIEEEGKSALEYLEKKKKSEKSPTNEFEKEIKSFETRRDVENAIERLLSNDDGAHDAFHDAVVRIGRRRGLDYPHAEDLDAEEMVDVYRDMLNELGYLTRSKDSITNVLKSVKLKKK